MLKIRCAVGLALLVGVFTILSGFGHNARPTTVLYRTAVSMLIFAVIGFGIGVFWERFAEKLLARFDNEASESGEQKNVEAADFIHEVKETPEEESFDELKPEDFENISHPKE